MIKFFNNPSNEKYFYLTYAEFVYVFGIQIEKDYVTKKNK
jgi:hypothetical protein